MWFFETFPFFNGGKTTAIEAFKNLISELKQLKDEYIKFSKTFPISFIELWKTHIGNID